MPLKERVLTDTGKFERYRPAGLARRRHRAHLRHADVTPARAPALGMGRSNETRQASLTAALGGCLRFM